MWAFFGVYAILAVAILGFIMLFGFFWKVVVIAFIAFLLARLIVSPLIFLVYKKSRPYQLYQFTTFHSKWLLSPPTTKKNSFPSDHAASLAAIATVFYWYLPSVGIAIALLAAINGYARIVLGYHDEWDILGGWVVGVASAAVVIHLVAPYIFAKF